MACDSFKVGTRLKYTDPAVTEHTVNKTNSKPRSNRKQVFVSTQASFGLKGGQTTNKGI